MILTFWCVRKHLLWLETNVLKCDIIVSLNSTTSILLQGLPLALNNLQMLIYY